MSILSKAKDLAKSLVGKPATQVVTALALTSPVVQAVAAIAKPATTIKVAQASLPVGAAIAGGILGGKTGVAVGGAAGAALSGISQLETAPKTSKAVQAVEKATGTQANKLLGLIGKNPVVAATALAALPVVALAGASAVSSASKVAGSGLGSSLAVKRAIEPTTSAVAPYTPIPVDNALDEGEYLPQPSSIASIPSSSTMLPTDTGISKDLPEGEGAVSVLRKDKRRRRLKPKPPIRIYNRVDIGVRNIFKPAILVN